MMQKLFLVIPFLCLLASPSWAAITEVASQRATATACSNFDTCAKAFPNNVTVGNLLVGGGTVADNTTTPAFAVTDSVGTSYSTIVCAPNLDNGTDRTNAFLFYGLAGGSGANTVTVNPTFDTSANVGNFSIDEFTGVHATPLDVDGGSSNGSSNTPSDSITTVTANDLLLGVMGNYTSVTLNTGGSYTQIGEDENGFRGHHLEFRLVTTVQAYTVDWNTSSSTVWHACTAAFKEAVAGTFKPPSQRWRFE